MDVGRCPLKTSRILPLQPPPRSRAHKLTQGPHGGRERGRTCSAGKHPDMSLPYWPLSLPACLRSQTLTPSATSTAPALCATLPLNAMARKPRLRLHGEGKKIQIIAIIHTTVPRPRPQHTQSTHISQCRKLTRSSIPCLKAQRAYNTKFFSWGL